MRTKDIIQSLAGTSKIVLKDVYTDAETIDWPPRPVRQRVLRSRFSQRRRHCQRQHAGECVHRL